MQSVARVLSIDYSSCVTRSPHDTSHMTMNTPDVATGDPDALKRLERFGGLKLREELTTLFLKEAPARIATARTALAGGDVEAVRAMAHMLKSSAGQMGALRVEHICARLESADPSLEIAPALLELDEELARYRAWLENAFPSPDVP
jgi:HPt (histidine-containing phosphotransfer) domain-containing protein